MEGRPAPIAPARKPEVTTLLVSHAYLKTLALPIRQGREWRDGKAGREEAIVNMRFASQYFAGENAVGTRIRLEDRARRTPPSNTRNATK